MQKYFLIKRKIAFQIISTYITSNFRLPARNWLEFFKRPKPYLIIIAYKNSKDWKNAKSCNYFPFWTNSSENPRFVEALKDLESSPICQALKMQSFLMLPMQRITRLPLLIGAIFSRLETKKAKTASEADEAEADNEDYQACQEALDIINKVCTVQNINVDSASSEVAWL